jgi:hypothetical protein
MAENIQYTLSLKDLFSKTIHDADGEANKFEGTMGKIQHALMEVGAAVGIAFGIHKLVEFGTELLHINAEFEGYHNVIKYASLGTHDAAANTEYLEDAIRRLHLPMRQSYEQFSELQGGMYGTGIEGQKLRDVFEGIAEASLVMHMNGDQFGRTVYALKEVGELHALQSRQMRMLALALPGAMNLAAEAMKMSTDKLHEGMRNGTIRAGEFLPKFAAKLKEHFGAGLENAGHSLIAEMNDTESEFIRLQLQMGEDLRPIFVSIMQTIIDLINKVKELWKWFMDHKAVLHDLKDVLEGLIITWTAYKTIQLASLAVTKLNVLWEGIQYASITLLGDGMLTASAMTKLWAGTQVLLNEALIANPIGVVIMAIAAVVTAVILAYNHFEKFRAFVWATWAVLKEFASMVKTIFEALWHTLHGVFTFDVKEMALAGQMELDVMRNSAHRLAEAAKSGWNDGIADFGKGNTTPGLLVAAGTAGATSGIKDAAGTGPGTDKGATSKVSGQKTINIRIDIKNLINTLSINTTNLKDTTGKIQEHVTKALLSAVNDSQIVAGQ